MGSWNTMDRSGPRRGAHLRAVGLLDALSRWCSLDLAVPQGVVLDVLRLDPGVLAQVKRMMEFMVTLLPQPDSPTTASVGAALQLEGNVLYDPDLLADRK